MVDVVLFHHVQGLTDGVQEFADELRAGGHAVHAPDPGKLAAVMADGKTASWSCVTARRSTLRVARDAAIAARVADRLRR